MRRELAKGERWVEGPPSWRPNPVPVEIPDPTPEEEASLEFHLAKLRVEKSCTAQAQRMAAYRNRSLLETS